MNISKFLILFLSCIIPFQDLLAQSEKVDSQQLNEVMHFSDSTGASKATVIYDSKIIGSFISSDCDSTYMNTASMVKSWTGLAVGLLIKNGLIESENEGICKYVPEWEAGCEKNITIKQLLTMSSGLLKIRPASQSIIAQDDMNTFALNTQIRGEPGAKFSYSNEGVQLLGLLIEKVSGKDANTFFNDNLFEPLDMDSTSLFKDKAGNDMVYGGAKTTVEDASKIGLLMLNRGVYNNKRIISREWFQKSIEPSETANFYGYLWWLDPSNSGTTMDNYAAMGDLGQMTIIFPEKRLIYMRQQSCKNEKIPNMNWMGPKFLKMIGKITK